MKKFDIELINKIGMTLKEFEIIEDVLCDIGEFKEYDEKDDEKALRSLQEFFSYKHYKIYKSIVKKVQ